jgi:hypothetical protein
METGMFYRIVQIREPYAEETEVCKGFYWSPPPLDTPGVVMALRRFRVKKERAEIKKNLKIYKSDIA